MNAKTKKRLIIVTGIIIIVMVVVLAVVGGSSAAKTVSVEDAASGQYVDQRVQVSGNVVENSYTTEGNVLSFSIYDPDNAGATVDVQYDGGVASTFGNDVTAICTGKIGSDGVLQCSELVTKCPSKYESSTDAIGVSQLLGYGDSIYDKTVKVTGQVQAGTMTAAGSTPRFVLTEADGSAQMPVAYDGALSDDAASDGATLVLTGHLGSDGTFSADDVALQG